MKKCTPKAGLNIDQTFVPPFETPDPVQAIQLSLDNVLIGPNDLSNNQFHIANRFNGIFHLQYST